MKKLTRILSVLLATILLISSVACVGNDTDNTASNDDVSQNASGTASSGVSAQTGTYFATDIWKQVPLVTQAAKDMGYTGGEGCQWPTLITFDSIDGSVAFCGVDVGGLVKSTDGGKSWAQCTVGLKSEGSTGIGIDPKNNDRVVVIGGSSAKNAQGGLYFSTDEGESWTPKVLMKIHGGRDYRRQVGYDETSYDETLGGCKVIYWVTEDSKLIEKGIYKSTDGGENWAIIPNSAEWAGSNITVHASTGDIYLTNAKGLYKSTDGAATFTLLHTAAINYLAVSKAAPDDIYFTTDHELYVYNIKSGSCTKRNESGYPSEYANYLAVAPSDPNKMVVAWDKVGLANQGGQLNFYSTDGGRTWSTAKCDYSGSFIPNQSRQNPMSFHPTDPNIVIKLGGDFIMRSTDGGATYKMSSDGYNVMCIGTKFNFNVNNPKLISVSSQDYNGGFSIDGGNTWTYLCWSEQGWGGFTYGSYMINETTAVAGLADSWHSNTGEVEIVTTFDGGKTINHTGIKTKAETVAMGVKGDENIVFYADYRSTDAGRTWNKMTGCTGVFTSSSDGTKLFGTDNFYLVMSTDKGVTWQQVGTIGGKADDVAYSDKTGKLYACSGGVLYDIDMTNGKITSIKVGSSGVKSVCVDPVNNDIIYVACLNNNDYANDSAIRSVDGGKTWTCINRAAGDGREGPDGGRAANFVRVDGEGSAWFVGHCRGLWKIPRPELG